MKTIIVKPKKEETIKVSEDTQVVLDLEGVEESDVRVVFEKQGVSAELFGMYLTENSSMKLHTTAEHKVPNTSCNTIIRGVLGDNGISEYMGKIRIDYGAQQTASYLDDAVLVVGQNTNNRSDPVLEIHADDVKASHGATTGTVNEDQVYYLMSRGLTHEEAKLLIVDGFFESVISQIKDQNISEEFRKKLLKRNV